MFLHSNSTEDLQICRANRSSAPDQGLSKLLLFAHEAGKFLIGKMVGTLWIMPSLINEYTWAIMNKVTWWSKPYIPKFLGNILEGTNLFLSNPPKKTREFSRPTTSRGRNFPPPKIHPFLGSSQDKFGSLIYINHQKKVFLCPKWCNCCLSQDAENMFIFYFEKYTLPENEQLL